jgi:hypothetical protein
MSKDWSGHPMFGRNQNNDWREIRKSKLSPEVRRANRRAWIIWGVEVAFCLAIGALFGMWFGRAW